MMLLIISIGAILLGESISKKYAGSKFSAWWKRNMVNEVDDRFDI
jgi:hypothetical protein